VWDLSVEVLEAVVEGIEKLLCSRGEALGLPYQPGLEIRGSVGPGNGMG
jgi:hypothetical protein